MDGHGEREATRGLGNIDHGSDLFTSLTLGVEIMNERALSRVGSCAREVQDGQANIFSQLQRVIGELHADNKQFLQQAAMLVIESSGKSAGTGEMAVATSTDEPYPWLPKEVFRGIENYGVDTTSSLPGVPLSQDKPEQRENMLKQPNHNEILGHDITPRSQLDSVDSKADAGTRSRAVEITHSVETGWANEKSLETWHQNSLDTGTATQITHPVQEGQPLDLVTGRDGRHESTCHRMTHEASKNSVHGSIVHHGIVPVFTCPEMLKDEVRSALLKNRYDVKDFYCETGLAQMIAKSQGFELLTVAVVLLNSLWIAFCLDLNKEDILSQAAPIFQVGEHGFCACFLIELVVRYCAFKSTKVAFQDSWFVFDFVLVSLMVMETWIMTIVVALAFGGSSFVVLPSGLLGLMRLFRLARMARMARLLRWMPELLILLKGLCMASRSVFYTLVLLVLTIYIFAMVFRQLTDGTEIGQLYFSSVPTAMSTLLLKGTLPDLDAWVRHVGEEHMLYAVLLMVFILFATLTIMNMLIGVLVEVVANVSTMEHETAMVNMVRTKMIEMIHVLGLDTDGNDHLDESEFQSLLTNAEAAQFMQNVGVDVVGLVEFSEFIFKDRELTFPEFVEIVLQMRGSNQATVKDIVDMRKQVHSEFERLSLETSMVAQAVSRLQDHVKDMPTGEQARENQQSMRFLVREISKDHQTTKQNLDVMRKQSQIPSLSPNCYFQSSEDIVVPSGTEQPQQRPQSPHMHPPALFDNAAWTHMAALPDIGAPEESKQPDAAAAATPPSTASSLGRQHTSSQQTGQLAIEQARISEDVDYISGKPHSTEQPTGTRENNDNMFSDVQRSRFLQQREREKVQHRMHISNAFDVGAAAAASNSGSRAPALIVEDEV